MKVNLKKRAKPILSTRNYEEWFVGFEKELRERLKQKDYHNLQDLISIKEILGE